MRYFTQACPSCGFPSVLELDPEQVAAWRSGTLIQDAFPELGADTRELLMTGIHPACWEAAVGPEE